MCYKGQHTRKQSREAERSTEQTRERWGQSSSSLRRRPTFVCATAAAAVLACAYLHDGVDGLSSELSSVGVSVPPALDDGVRLVNEHDSALGFRDFGVDLRWSLAHVASEQLQRIVDEHNLVRRDQLHLQHDLRHQVGHRRFAWREHAHTGRRGGTASRDTSEKERQRCITHVNRADAAERAFPPASMAAVFSCDSRYVPLLACTMRVRVRVKRRAGGSDLFRAVH